ncbi:MAG TPA: hypothetical protein VFX58_00795, partial [Chitinophagaceae bacterium]|nr:hypothetical protein [Chitinophagaceae bacterium]
MKRFFSLLFMGLLCSAGVFGQAGTAPVVPPNPPAVGFAIDGYLERQGVAGDWLAAPGGSPAGTYFFSSTPPGAPLFPNPPILSYHPIDLWNDQVNDDIFDGGNKLFQDPNVWGWRSQKPPAKDDINNAMVAITENPADGHIWALISGDRLSTNGTSYLDFEFYQNSIFKTGGPIPGGTGGFVSFGPNGGRTIGDLSVTLTFTNGGSVISNISFLQWLPTSETEFDYLPVPGVPGTYYGAANPTNGTPVPYGAFGMNVYPDSLMFVEAAIDLTALLGAASNDPCRALIFKSLFIKTKSSAERTADLKDFISPIQFELNLGVSTIHYDDYCSGAGIQNPVLNDPAPPDQNVSWTISPANAGVTINASTGQINVGTVCTETQYVVTYFYDARPNCDTFARDTFIVTPPPPATLQNPPGNITVACGQIPAVSGLQYTNNTQGSCGISGTVTSTQTAAPGPCGGVVTETWASTVDVCGRTIAGHTRTITVQAATQASFTSTPGNITISCTAAPPLPTSLGYSNGGSGNCQISGSVTSTLTGSHTACGGSYTETWTFTDQCQRTITHSRVVTVSAAQQASFTSTPGNLTITCAAAPPAPTSLGYSNGGSGACQISGSVTSTLTGSHTRCGGLYTETWTFTDNCGRTITRS